MIEQVLEIIFVAATIGFLICGMIATSPRLSRPRGEGEAGQ